MAKETDKISIDALITGKPEKLLEQFEETKKKNIPNLSTSMCGWTSVVTLMYMAEKLSDRNYYRILYQNSGDASLYGDQDRVVGYQSVALTVKTKSDDFSLTENNKHELLDLARRSIKNYLDFGEKLSIKNIPAEPPFDAQCGAFVSIYINKELRGCIGRLNAGDVPLYETISEMAVSSAFFDGRFSPLTKDEFNDISIEISVLTPLKKISSIDEFKLGRHGIYIKKDFRSGTYLPQVAQKTKWSKEEYIGHCSRDKAGIGWDGWKNAELFTYEAIIFKD